MSTRVHCRDCGWDRHYRRPAAARRAVTRHRCPPSTDLSGERAQSTDRRSP
ncbi:hypothetical protein [Amycolatopsis sp. NPDC059657]|uniref:hypothetical protein n=1 Tax=Amycolatopsis sp. NPDC059657 TaxID=3346899 RepID=UPI0036712648